MTSARCLGEAHWNQACLTKRVYHADPCKPGYRRKPGAVPLGEIRHYQKGTKYLISMLPFMWLVQEVLNNKYMTGSNDFYIQGPAIAILQTAAEAYLTSWFEDTGLCPSMANE